jgi:L-ascorbate metabolism protein UlaG (beta-lactamase superfamily)
MDPYRPGALGGRINLQPIDVKVDIVAVTHFHEDHGWIGGLRGDPLVVDQTMTVGGIDFVMRTSPHDGCCGTQMGLNRMISFTLDGVRVLHPGDVGALPTAEILDAAGPVDLLLLPVGGVYTLPPSEALKLADAVDAQWIVPMHYRNAFVDLNMEPLDTFLALWPDERDVFGSESEPVAELDLDSNPAPGLYLMSPLAAKLA